MAIREGTVFWGVWGGFPPHYRAYRTRGVERGGLGGILPPIIGRAWAPCAKRGGLGGILPPILGRTRPPGINRGGPGRGGSNGAGLVRGSAAA